MKAVPVALVELIELPPIKASASLGPDLISPVVILLPSIVVIDGLLVFARSVLSDRKVTRPAKLIPISTALKVAVPAPV